MYSIHELPKDLPIPVDDGACNHRAGMVLPLGERMVKSGEKLEVYDVSNAKPLGPSDT